MVGIPTNGRYTDLSGSPEGRRGGGASPGLLGGPAAEAGGGAGAAAELRGRIVVARVGLGEG